MGILSDLSTTTLFFLVLAVGIALAFEFVNGFHDTANAVATVIYTKSLKPNHAVLWSGFCNFLGVYFGGIGVAFSVVYLLPVDLLINIDSGAGIAMVMSLLLAAIIWNFGTWYLGIPASSSHTLIGAILGVGLASSMISGNGFGSGVNWGKATQVGISLLVSPIIGFGSAAVLLLLAKRFFKNQALHEPAPDDRPPPAWIRGVLIFTCTGVSLAHGSNDGQKGIGLIMLILIGLVPAHYALNLNSSAVDVAQLQSTVAELQSFLKGADQVMHALDQLPWVPKNAAAPQTSPAGGRTETFPGSSVVAGAVDAPTSQTILDDLNSLHDTLQGADNLNQLTVESRWDIRTRIMRIDYAVAQISNASTSGLSTEKKEQLAQARKHLRGVTDYSPVWVIVAVAFALGVGTTIGWKRIVVTIGEKIGKTHMSYSQGACAELVATFAIGMADFLHLPVSTTHVLSSGVAGTMFANKSGIQASTIKSILLAWVLTLPATMILSAGLFLLLSLAL
ncbi:MAG: inorganic phosphate transporter [Planctomycetales bacterium]|nr:inorganic phosphate transporter [Planctomycetales bacterium]